MRAQADVVWRSGYLDAHPHATPSRSTPRPTMSAFTASSARGVRDERQMCSESLFRALTPFWRCWFCASARSTRRKRNRRLLSVLPRRSQYISFRSPFIGSGMLGGGTLYYGGQAYPFKLGGLGIGGIGVSRRFAPGLLKLFLWHGFCAGGPPSLLTRGRDVSRGHARLCERQDGVTPDRHPASLALQPVHDEKGALAALGRAISEAGKIGVPDLQPAARVSSLTSRSKVDAGEAEY